MEILILPFNYLRRFYLDTALLSQPNAYLSAVHIYSLCESFTCSTPHLVCAGPSLAQKPQLGFGLVTRDHENVEPPWSTALAGLVLRSKNCSYVSLVTNLNEKFTTVNILEALIVLKGAR